MCFTVYLNSCNVMFVFAELNQHLIWVVVNHQRVN